MRANNFKELVHFAQEQSIAAAFIARTKNSTQDDNNLCLVRGQKSQMFLFVFTFTQHVIRMSDYLRA